MKGNIARVGSVGPHVPEITKCMPNSQFDV